LQRSGNEDSKRGHCGNAKKEFIAHDLRLLKRVDDPPDFEAMVADYRQGQQTWRQRQARRTRCDGKRV